MRVLVDNRVRLEGMDPEGDLASRIRARFDHANPQREAMRRMGLPHWKEPKVISTSRAEGGVLTVPRGGMQRVRDSLREAGQWPAVVVDGRTDGEERNPGFAAELSRPLWAHQQHAVEEFLEREQGIIRAPTGSGKTTIGFALAARLQVWTMVVVNGRGLLDQWVSRAEKELGIPSRDVGIVQGSKCRLRPLTVAMQPALAHHGVSEEMKRSFGFLFCDEAQMFAAKTFFAVVDPFPARYRAACSADQRRKDGKDFLVGDLFGDLVADISRDELEDEGLVLDVEVRVVFTDFRADWYGVPDEGEEDEEKEIDPTRLYEEMGADAARNQIGVEIAAEESEREVVFVMAAQRAHCLTVDQQLAARGVRTGTLIGGPDYRAEFVRTRDSILSGKTRVGVGTIRAIGTGLDFPKVGVAVVMTPIASNRQLFGQVRGRVCRSAEGKTSARMYYLYDRRVFGLKHLQNLVRWTRTVRVKVGDEWVDGRAFLRAERAGARHHAATEAGNAQTK